MKIYDAIIIGFGKGGKTLAVALAERGFSVAVVEQSKNMYGGTCINIACIPTKSLIYQAEELARNKKDFAQKAADYRKAIVVKDQLTAFLRQKNLENLTSRENITVYTGEASFRSTYEVEVQTEGDPLVLGGKRIFIDTGAEPVIPDIPGVRESSRVYTSTTLQNVDELPKRLLIVGGGYIGLEFASMYASFGSEVTVLESGPRLLPREDEDIARSVRQSLEKKGIVFYLKAMLQEVEDTEEGTEATFSVEEEAASHIFQADAILLATGRKPHTFGLNLAAAGVELTEQGAVAVDEHLNTSMPNIWALGDVKGGLQFTYISLDDFRIIKDNLFGCRARTLQDREPVAYTVFIDPPLSRIGLSEEEAQKKGLRVKVRTLPAMAVPRALVLEKPEGLLKAVVDADTGLILGCALHCADSGEVINTVALAMRTNQPFSRLRDMIFTHPSMSEALNEVFSFPEGRQFFSITS